jgi:hypothetical protein
MLLITLVAAISAPYIPRAQERNYLLATASAGGTFYPVGVALATLVTAKLQQAHGIRVVAINSAGSEENVELLRNSETQFAILQGLFGHYAWTGTGPVAKKGPLKALRSVMTLWYNVEQFTILTKHVKTGTVADLQAAKGMNVAFGKKNSGTLNSNRLVLSRLGFDIDKDFELVYLGYGPSADALQSGRVAAISTPGGVPTGAVTRAMAAMGMRITILNITDEQARRADGGMGLWTRYIIPAGTYPSQERQIETIAQPNLLAVRADVDEETVYRITKVIYENLSFLHSIHTATRVMALERALTGLSMPLHPGAIRYYKEVGLEVPSHLVAN